MSLVLCITRRCLIVIQGYTGLKEGPKGTDPSAGATIVGAGNSVYLQKGVGKPLRSFTAATLSAVEAMAFLLSFRVILQII